MQVIVLLTDAFGGFGGISRFNRDLLEAIANARFVERVRVWPRIISEPLVDMLPEAVVFERKFANGKLRYLMWCASMLFSRAPVDVVVCAHINLLAPAWLIATARGVPLVVFIFGIEAWRPTANLLSNFLARRVTRVVSISRYTARRFAEWTGANPDLCTILPCCVDMDRFTPGPRNPTLIARYGLERGPILLTVGRLAPEERYKGFDEVLAALPRLVERFPDLRYIVGGDGPDADRLKQSARALGVSDHVVFTGRIDEAEKVDHYRLADVFVMPSTGEGFGIVLIEAAACGVPVIGSKMDGSAEAVLEGRIGPIVDPRRQEELIEAVASILSAPPIGVRRAHPLVGNFSVGRFGQRVGAWLQNLASELR